MASYALNEKNELFKKNWVANVNNKTFKRISYIPTIIYNQNIGKLLAVYCVVL